MKITSADCVKVILKYFYEKEVEDFKLLKADAWKRLSKTGTGDKIIRTFVHKETGKTVIIYSTETKILKIVEGPSTITNLKEFLRENLINAPEEFWNVHYDIFGEDNVVNWPQISMSDFSDDPEDQGIEEPLDMENFEWLSITDDELVVACGGDWQEPLTLTMRIVDGKLTVINYVSGYEEGLSQEEVLNLIRQ